MHIKHLLCARHDFGLIRWQWKVVKAFALIELMFQWILRMSCTTQFELFLYLPVHILSKFNISSFCLYFVHILIATPFPHLVCSSSSIFKYWRLAGNVLHLKVTPVLPLPPTSWVTLGDSCLAYLALFKKKKPLEWLGKVISVQFFRSTFLSGKYIHNLSI